MATTWKWTDREAGVLEVTMEQANLVMEMKLSEEGLAYLNEVGCECRPVPIPEMEMMIIAGQDDCPVHGFGE